MKIHFFEKKKQIIFWYKRKNVKNKLFKITETKESLLNFSFSSGLHEKKIHKTKNIGFVQVFLF